MKVSRSVRITGIAAAILAIFLQNEVEAQVAYQRLGDSIGAGADEWHYLILEGESFDPATKVAAPDVGFSAVYADAALTNFYGNPVLGTNSTASKGGALFGQTIFGQYADKITYHVQFARTGTYYLYMRFTMFENGGATNSYLNEDSFFVPPDFGKDPQTDWPLSERGGYCEGGLSTSGFLWILEPCTAGARTNHSGNDGLDQAYYWEGNFRWNQCISSQFLNPDTQGEPSYPFRYEVTSTNVGIPLDFTIGYREGGFTPDLLLFSTHTNLMDVYSQTALDELLVNKVAVQDPADVVGTGTNAWSYLVMEAENYEWETNNTPGMGFTTVHAGDGFTNFYGNPVLAANTTASGGGALFGESIFAQYVDKISYQVQFARTGRYYLYMRFTMFENGGNTNNYLNEDSFFVPPDFGKDPQTDWPLSDRGGYCEGGLSTSGFLWIPEPGTGGARTNHSGNDGIDQSYYWEGNFRWNQCISSQFLNPDTQGVPSYPFQYEVTPDNVGKRLTFTMGYREGGFTPDLFLFSTHTNLMEHYTQDELDQLFARPKLKIHLAGSNARLSWPSAAATAGYQVESTVTLSPASWTPVPCPTPEVEGDWNSVTVDASGGGAYYRLRQQP